MVHYAAIKNYNYINLKSKKVMQDIKLLILKKKLYTECSQPCKNIDK